MNSTKFGFFALIFLFGLTILVPVLLTNIALADCGVYAHDYDRCDRCAFDGDLLRCDGCAIRDYDLSVVRNCDHCTSEYRCDLYGCGWVR